MNRNILAIIGGSAVGLVLGFAALSRMLGNRKHTGSSFAELYNDNKEVNGYEL